MPRKTVASSFVDDVIVWASMRPRPDAAENARHPGPDHNPARGFNEAAARCRGKRSM